MEVITRSPWKEESDKSSDPIPRNKFFFGIRDLTSDYYQVMIQKERPGWCKSLWFFIILGLLAFTVYVLYLMIADYILYGSYNKISTITTNSSIVLPAISICSLNVLNNTEFSSDVNVTNNVVQDVKDLRYNLAMISDPKNLSSISASDYPDLGAYDTKYGNIEFIFRSKVNQFISSTSYDYKLGKTHKNISNWVTGMGTTQLGSCIEVNDDQEFTQSIRGSNYGLTFDLDTSIADYLDSTESSGFKVFIRSPDETVFLNEGGIVIAPGTETFMNVNVEKVTRLTSPYGSCSNTKSKFSRYDDTYQTIRECLQTYKIEAMISSCQCIPWYVVEQLMDLENYDVLDDYVKLSQNGTENLVDYSRRRKRDTEWESDDDFNYFERWNSSDDRYANYSSFDDYFLRGPYEEYICTYYNQYYCDVDFALKWEVLKDQYTCHEPCSYSKYSVKLFTSLYPPTQAYYNTFLSDSTESYEYAQNNLIRLHIFYDDIEYINNVQTADYEIQNFIGELGGVVDLFIGFSFFTIFQLMEIMLAMFFMRCWKGSKKTEDIEMNNKT